MTHLHTNYSVDEATVNGMQSSSSSLECLVENGFRYRAGSESNLSLSMYTDRSSLKVNRTSYHIGSDELVKISWCVQEDISPMDWIALSRITDDNPDGEVMDYKSRGVSGERTGNIEWKIDELQHYFQTGDTEICFKYFHGPSGTLRAVSPILTVTKDPASSRSEQKLFQIFITDIHAQHLKKGMFFNPDPFVRISVAPIRNSSSDLQNELDPDHYNQVAKTSVIPNTTTPYWRNSEIELIVTQQDFLVFEVRHQFMKKSAAISKLLGQLSVPVQKLLSKQDLGVNTINLNLMRRHPPHDNISGILSFTFDLLTEQGDHRRSVIHSSFPRTNSIKEEEASGSIEQPDNRQYNTLPRGFRQRKGITSSLAEVKSIPCTTGQSLPILSNSVIPIDNEWNDASDEASTAATFEIGSLSSAELMSPPTDDSSDQARSPFDSDTVLETLVQDVQLDDTEHTFRDDLRDITEERSETIAQADDIELLENDTLASIDEPEPSPTTEPIIPTDITPEDVELSIAEDPASALIVEATVTTNDIPNDDIDPLPQSTEDADETSLPLSPDGPEVDVRDEIEASDLELPLDNIEDDSTSAATVPNAETEETVPDDITPSNVPDIEGASAVMQDESTGDVADLQNNDEPDVLDVTPDVPVNPLGRQLRGLQFIESEASENSYASILQQQLEHSINDASDSRQAIFRPSPPVASPPDDVLILEPPSTAANTRRAVSVRPPPGDSQQLRRKVARVPSLLNAQEMYRQNETIPDTSLPSGWDTAVDAHGRVFYIDHVNRTTTWHKPTESSSIERVNSMSLEARHNLEQRYNTVQRAAATADSTASESLQQSSSSQSSSSPSELVAQSDAIPPSMSPEKPTPEERKLRKATHSRTERMDIGLLMNMPSVVFLTRPDLKTFLQQHDQAWEQFEESNSIKHMISRVRRDPQAFLRYRHNRDLVAFLNTFVDESQPMPDKWDQKMDSQGKKFFIDHNSKSTTFIDPRLPMDTPATNPSKKTNPIRTFVTTASGDSASTFQAQPSQPHVSASYHERIVAFLRQPNAMELIKSKRTLNSTLKDKIHRIKTDGLPALLSLTNDVELITILSLFDQEISAGGSPATSSPRHSPALPRRVQPQQKRDFQAKLANFYKKLHQKGFSQGPGKLKCIVRREHVLEDAYNKIMSASKKELQRSKLVIHFAHEEGLDYGGPGKEFFFLLSQELFNPYYGLFEYSANDTYTVQLSPVSTFVDNYQDWFKFAGRVLGLAVVNQYLLDAFFTRPFYKMLLKMPWSLSDLESLDAEFHQSLLWIKENDITDMGLDLTFSVDEEIFGQLTEKDLKHNGRNIPVTEKNKREYIDRIVNWRIERGVHEQCEFLLRGFYEVIDHRMISMFDASELELVIAGVVEIDITDWRKHTEYRSGYHDKHSVVQFFWMAVERFDNERRLRLLQFVTGSSSVPYEGFSALRGSNGPRKFCVEKWGKTDSLPRAHTCFNRLDLPAYSSFEVLFDKLVTAIEETNTFSIE